MKQFDYTIVCLNMFGTPFHPKRILRSLMRNQVRMRFKAMSNVINALDADILLLQEIHDYASLYFLRHQLKDFPFIAYHHMLF